MRGSVTPKAFTPVASEDDVGLHNDPMYYLQRLFVYFLQNLFRDFPEGCGMKWNPNEELSEIVVSAEKPELEAVEKRPHITCVLGSSRFTGLGLDQLQTQRTSDGERTHTDLVPAVMGYHCQAKKGMHARRIAWNAALATVQLKRILMRVGGLFHVDSKVSVGPEGSITQYAGPSVESPLIEVVANVPFYWQPQWRIRKPSEVWRRLEFTLRVNEARPIFNVSRQVRLPMLNGTPVDTRPIEPPRTAFTQVVYDSSFFGEEE